MQVASVTEQWAQVAVAGPRARELLNGVLDVPVDDAGFPFMACGAVAVARGRGAALPHLLLGRARLRAGGAGPLRRGALRRCWSSARAALGGGPYGLEALNVLRIEKGLLTHAELHGRTTADDLGLGRMVAAGKDCIGKAGAARPGLSGAGARAARRPAAARPRRAAAGRRACPRRRARRSRRRTTSGYLTSHCHSPTLGHDIALGFVQDGRARHRRDGCGRSAGCAGSTRPARSCRRSSSIPREGGCVAELAARGAFDGLGLPLAVGEARLAALPPVRRAARRALRGRERRSAALGVPRARGAADGARRAAALGGARPVAARGARRRRRRRRCGRHRPDRRLGGARAGRCGARRCWRGWCRSTSTPRPFRPERRRGAAAPRAAAPDRHGRRVRADGAAVLCADSGARACRGDARGRGAQTDRWLMV